MADLRAALSGMSGSLNMSGDSLPAGLSESLLFDGMVSRNQIIGGFYTFGHNIIKDVITDDFPQADIGLLRQYAELIGMIKRQIEECPHCNVL